MRIHAFVTSSTLFALALSGCPIDLSSDSSGGPTGSPNLTPTAKVGDLSPSDLSVICARNLSTLQAVNSAQTQCTMDAVRKADDEAACTAARDACVVEQMKEPAQMCQMLSGKIDCPVTVQELEDCLRAINTWASGLTCSLAGKAPAPPACAEMQEKVCEGLDDLYSDKVPPPAQDDDDSGVVEPGDRDAGEGSGDACVPGARNTCACAGGAVGVTTCDSDSAWGACRCGDITVPDAGIGGGGDGCEGYDLGSGESCNTCATSGCCDSYIACREDVGCDCFWECLEFGGVDCDLECGLDTEYPDQFLVHSSCLEALCQVECGL
jgi:hypothetical protein